MTKRFMIMSAFFGVVVFLQFSDLKTRDGTLFYVFFILFAMLVIFGVALWPTSSRDQRVDMRMDRANWGDRIDIEKARGKVE